VTIAERGLRIAERVADWVLRRSLPPGDAGDTIRGDLIEEWHARGETLHATRWYWRETLSVASHYGAKMFFETLLQDVRYTVRSYIKAPGFALIILTTLALGIGASTAIFSLVNGILLRPLPLPEPDRLVYVNETNAKGDFISISWPNYLDWRLRTRSFDAIGISRDEPVTLTGVERAQRFRGARVSGNFFTMLGVAPAIGRTFTDDDDKPTSAPVAILSDACWRGQMAGDPSIVGRTITLDGTQYTVVGVMPRGFQFPRSAYPRPHDIFLSMGPYANTPQVRDRGNHIGFSATARLKAGVTATMADRELKMVAAALEREYPNTNTSVSARVVPLADQLVNNVRLTLLVLFGAVVCLLLIACVNVANLLIARGASRQHELAIRAALGGGRARLVGLLLVESTVVCGAGGALGVAIAVWLLRTLVAVAPPGTPRIENASIDGAALLFAVVASTLCGAVFGALPALQASSVGAQSVLIRGRANAFSARSHRLRRGLLVVETALALVLLTAAGLMMRTLQELTRVDTGIRVDHVLTARVNLAGPQWTVPKRVAFYDQVIGRVRALPGVTNAALASSLPIDGSQWNSIFIVGDKPVPERSKLPNAAFTPVSAGYFDTIGMRLIRGRYLDATDTADSAKTIVVNETLAGRLWPGENPVGKRLKQGWPETPERISPWRQIVGVVSDVKMNGITAETPL